MDDLYMVVDANAEILKTGSLSDCMIAVSLLLSYPDFSCFPLSILSLCNPTVYPCSEILCAR